MASAHAWQRLMVAMYCPAVVRRAVTSSPLAMSADPSNTVGYRLPRRNILRGKDPFEALFKQGIRLAGTYADLRYISYPNPARERKVACIAGRRLGNAVTRNRGKRLLREAYRLHQHLLDPVTEQSDLSLHLAFILKTSHCTYPQLSGDMRNLLQRLADILHPAQETT